jgi:hypothetical protein
MDGLHLAQVMRDGNIQRPDDATPITQDHSTKQRYVKTASAANFVSQDCTIGPAGRCLVVRALSRNWRRGKRMINQNPTAEPAMSISAPDPINASMALRTRYAGSFVGILCMCAIVLLAPLVARTFGLAVVPAWGLGATKAGWLCLTGATPGFAFAPRFVHLGKSFKLIG